MSYVFYKAPSIVDALNSAIQRQVRVKLLLQSSFEQGGTIRGDSAKTLAVAVPGATVYAWDPSGRKHDVDGSSAAVHAKCAVADRKLAFITSANLTLAALERNRELGVLIRGGTVPERLHAHLEALAATGVIAMRAE